MRVNDLKKRSVCIVCFGTMTMAGKGERAGDFFQVTVDPNMVSGDAQFIRFGNFPGDELLGWQNADKIEVCEVLGEWEGDEPPVMTYGTLAGVTT